MAPKITVPKSQKLSLLLIIVAIGYFYIQVEYSFGFEPKKVDENAVQAGLVLPVLNDKFKPHFDVNERALRSKCSSIKSIQEWISSKWSQYSIENYIFDSNDTDNNALIYGIHRSPFSDGKTATIIGLSYDIEDIKYSCKTHKNKKALSSIAAFITISTALSTTNWCSKDLIFIFIQREKFNYKYQQNQLSSNKHVTYPLFEQFSNEILPKYTNIVVGGIIIEIPLYSQSRVLSISVAGPLGFQPNYDIVATSITTFSRMNFVLNIAPYFKKTWANINLDNVKPNAKQVEKPDELRKSMLRSMAYQSVGKSSGYHGYLVKHQIDAISLISNEYYDRYNDKMASRSQLNKDGTPELHAMFNLCKSIELFTRAMSNLIEIFHHSTFNYILISQGKFITMAKYSIPIGLIGLSPLIESFAIYTNCYKGFDAGLFPAVVTLVICVIFGVYVYGVIYIVINVLDIDLYFSIIGAIFMILIALAVLIKIWHLFNKEEINDNYYISFKTLLNIYAMFSQIWLPIALNFSAGLYFVIVTAAMLHIVRRKAKLEDIQQSQDVIDKDGSDKNNDTERENKDKDKVNNDTETDNKDDEDKDDEIMDNANENERGKEEEKKVVEKKRTLFIEYGMKFRLLRMMCLLAIPILAVYGIMFIMEIDLFTLMKNLKYDLLNEDIYNKHPGWIVVFFTIIPTYLGCWFLLCFA